VRAGCGAVGLWVAGVPGFVYAWLSLDDDRDAAAEALLPGLEARRRSGRYDRLFELAGVDSVGVGVEAARAMAVGGDAGDCAAGVRALAEAGAESVVLVPREHDAAQQVERFVAEVVPRLR
jgi:hypothetical protein